MDNYAAHQTSEVRDGIAANPRIHVHFRPTSASRLNLVEVSFTMTERQTVHRCTLGSVKDLNAKIRGYRRLERPHPPVTPGTKTADEILEKAHRKTTLTQAAGMLYSERVV